MPSKSVSFSDEAYSEIINAQPENMNFSEWVETAATSWIEAQDSETEA